MRTYVKTIVIMGQQRDVVINVIKQNHLFKWCSFGNEYYVSSNHIREFERTMKRLLVKFSISKSLEHMSNL